MDVLSSDVICYKISLFGRKMGTGTGPVVSEYNLIYDCNEKKNVFVRFYGDFPVFRMF